MAINKIRIESDQLAKVWVLGKDGPVIRQVSLSHKGLDSSILLGLSMPDEDNIFLWFLHV